MTTTAARLRSLTTPPRVTGLDLARALAVIGMIGAHMGAADALVPQDPSTWGAVVHGRSSLLFALIAGVSIALTTKALTRDPDVDTVRTVRLRMLGRGMVIFGLGVLLEMLGTNVAVILSFYGIFFLAAIPFLTWRRRNLLLVAVPLGLLGPAIIVLLSGVVSQGYGPARDLALTGVYSGPVWLAVMLVGLTIGRSSLTSLRTALTLLLGGMLLAAAGYGLAGLAGSVVSPGPSIGASTSSQSSAPGLVPGDQVDISRMQCDVTSQDVYCFSDAVGMSVPSDGSVSSEGVPTGYLGGSVTGIDPLGALRSYGQFLLDGLTGQGLLPMILSAEPHSGGVGEVTGSTGVAMAVLGGCLLLTRPRAVRLAVLPLAALGSMPLTAYTLHVLSVAVLAGPGGVIDSDLAWGMSVLVLILGVTVWTALVGRGPLERFTSHMADAMACTRRQ